MFKKLFELWKKFAHVLGQVQTTILLTLVYHLAIGPIALFGKVTGWDLLGLKPPKDSSYAAALPPPSTTLDRAQQQF